MKYISKVISLSALLALSVSALPVSQNVSKVVKILVDKPDSITAEKWDDYCSSMKSFFTTTSNENPIIRDYDIDFSYKNDEVYDKSTTKYYENYIKSIIKELKSNTYDMLILDDKFLFSENALIGSEYVDSTFGREIHKEFVDLTSDIQKESIAFHDSSILDYGYYENHLYALPFEKDFDVLYYRNDNQKLNKIDMSSMYWDNLLSMNKLSVATANDDELLNLFIEYTNEKIDLTGQNKNENYEKLYNESSKDIYDAFRTLVSMLGNNADTNVSYDNAYKSFIDNKTDMFKGKASQYLNILNSQNSKNIIMNLPPKNVSVLNKKFLVINKNSLIDRKVLIETALKITSKEMQLFRAERFGNIPTFDLKQGNSDSSIKTYIEKNSESVTLLNNMIPIHLKSVFESKTSPPFMEIRALLPQDIRNNLKDAKDDKLANVFENTQKLLMNKRNVIHLPSYLLYAPMILFTILSFIVIILIFRYRQYPCLKVFSPGYCILSIIGIMMSIIYPIFEMNATKEEFCKYRYIFATILTDLTLFPMVAVTYRLYNIYKLKANDDKKKNLNSRIAVFFLIGMLIMIIYSTCSAVFFLKFHFSSYGTIDTYRQQVCYATGPTYLESLERRVNELIVSINI